VDPGNGPGDIDIDWMQLTAPDGTVLRTWDFDEA